MRQIFSITCLIGFGLMLLNCNSGLVHKDDGSPADTVLVRDTIIVRDTIKTAEKFVFPNAAKMNIFYIGVDNPIHLELAGINPNDLRIQISGGGGNLRKINGTDFIVTVSEPGEAAIIITEGGISKVFRFRIKRLPDPIVRLSNRTGGNINNAEFKAEAGLIAVFDNFDFDAKCEVTGFKMSMIPRRSEPIEVENPGARFSGRTKDLVNRAKPGDIYIFSDVKVKCPGDPTGRLVNSLAFKIL